MTMGSGLPMKGGILGPQVAIDRWWGYTIRSSPLPRSIDRPAAVLQLILGTYTYVRDSTTQTQY